MLSPSLTPRRILMTTDAVGGVWRYAVELCRSLNEAGIEVVLCCLGPGPTKAQRSEVASLRRTNLFVLPLPLDWMAEAAAELDEIPTALAELSETCSVDLLHLNLPTQACGLHTSKPVIVASHSCVVTWWQAMRRGELPDDWQEQYRRNAAGLAAADAVVVPSRCYGELLADAYGPVERLQVVPNAVSDIGRPPSTMAPEGALRQQERYVFAAARWWDESKNARLLEDAAVLSSLPIIAAGPCAGPNRQSFAFAAVTALGSLLPAEVRNFMRSAEAFVSPSLYEPFGLAAMEAAHGGTPLILADIPTYREIWSDAALFIQRGDARELADAIEELAENARLRDALGRTAQARAAEFGPERQLKLQLAVYRSAAANAMEHKAAAEAFCLSNVTG